MEFKRLISQGWRKKANMSHLVKLFIMLSLTIYILTELKGL